MAVTIVKKSELSDMISMRLTPEDSRALDSVAALVPVIPRLALARVAMRLGLEQIQKNPARALVPKAK